MSDWNDRLDARRRGEEEGFHGADQPLEELAPEDQPAVETPEGGRSPQVAAQEGAAAREQTAADAEPATTEPVSAEPTAEPAGDGQPTEGV